MEFIFPDRVRIAQLPTPIQRLTRLSELFGGPEIYVKRDDLTGSAVSGNKIRKLEFTAAQALREKCDVLITCGGLQSNHARATAAVAAHLGLKSHLVLAGEPTDLPDGNLFIDLLMGSKISYLPGKELDDLNEYMQELASTYAKKGLKAFIVPLGASDGIGAMGYVNAIKEMMTQFKELGFTPDHILMPSGSGGTQAGLIIGKQIFGLSSNIVGINVRMNRSYFIQEIQRVFDEFRNISGYDAGCHEHHIHITDGYVGAGYAKTSVEEMRFIAKVAQTEGIILDTAYTGKAMYGLYREIKKKTFHKDQKVLFIHTGGLFGLLPLASRFSKEVFQTG